MKKFLVPIVLILFSLASLAQTATDENGNKVYNGSSVAIFTRMHKYTFNSAADMTMSSLAEMDEGIRVGFQVMATSAAQTQGLRVVNRDDATFKAAQAWIEESKNEDYLDGLSARAKKIGATHMLIQDIRMYSYGNAYIAIEVLRNIVCVQTNISCRFVTKHWLPMTGPDTSPAMIAKEKQLLRKYLMDAFPGFFVLNKYNGKTVYLGVASLFGVDANDEVCFYKWENIKAPVKGQLTDFSKMELLATGTIDAKPKIVNGFLQLKINNKLSSTENLVIKLGDALHSEINTYKHLPVAIVELKPTGSTMDDYCKIQINNALSNMLYNNPFINLIESDGLSLIKKERELQKTEDFIDGSVIEQFKASSASYILCLSDYSQKNQIVNFKISFVNIESGSVEKETLIKCHVSNIYDVVNYNVNNFFVAPVAISAISKKQVVVYPVAPIASKHGESFTILYNKPIKNPINGETIYNRIPLAKCILSKWNCQEYIMTVNEILDKEDFDKLSTIKNTDLFFLQKDLTEPKNIMTDNTFAAIK